MKKRPIHRLAPVVPIRPPEVQDPAERALVLAQKELAHLQERRGLVGEPGDPEIAEAEARVEREKDRLADGIATRRDRIDEVLEAARAVLEGRAQPHEAFDYLAPKRRGPKNPHRLRKEPKFS